MVSRCPPSPLSRAAGVALVLAMVFLLLLALLAAAAMQTSILEQRMAANKQMREEARQHVRGILSSLMEHPENFPLESTVGFRRCHPGGVAPACDRSASLTLAAALVGVSIGRDVSYQVERIGPRVLPDLPVRLPQHRVSSSLAYSAFLYEARATADGRSRGLGYAEAIQGIARLVTKEGIQ